MDIAALIKSDPERAKAAVRAAFEAAGSASAAAEMLGVHKSTFGRWAAALGLFLHSERHGKRGPDKRKSRSRVRAQRARREGERSR